jgi:hypothetical protein
VGARIRLILVLCGLCAASCSDQIPASSEAVKPAAIPNQIPPSDVVYVCPMDPDVRQNEPGSCRRCGMTLVAGVPDPVEFHLDVSVIPDAPMPGRGAALHFSVRDPWKNRPVGHFNLVHERLFHAFVVSQDLQFFEHGHPTSTGEGEFEYPVVFPTPGMYRVLGDFYPAGATPQLIAQTVFVPGAPPGPAHLARDYSTKDGANLQVSLSTIPDQPVATHRTQLRFTLDSARGLQPYLAAWAHLLAASDDLIDLMHEHPFVADGGPRIEFEIVFPRPRTYRLWVQFQKENVVNTVRFDVPAGVLR